MDGAAANKFVRDRGLDHAVEREKNLRPLLDVKNLIKSEPSKSLPITIISQQRDSLKIPCRPIEFIRKYPSVFQEFLPGGIGIHPHIKLTPEVLDIDAEEHLVYQSDSYKRLVADRLLKLLMISKMNKIPIRILDLLKWDLGLPQNYLKTLVPDFPDYFRLVGGEDSGELELVCWSDKLAVSVLEMKAMEGTESRSSIAFPVKFSKGFEMDKKLKKWWDDWQKLPYVSPYENALHLLPKSDESDKWAAAVLHEILNLFVAKKAARDDVLCLGEYLGIRSRFKRVVLHHPHIFYISSKNTTYTVVLKEAYKRGLLTESNPLMVIRNRYIHLMHTTTVKENGKDISIPSGTNQEKTDDDDDSEEEKVSNDLSSSDEDDETVAAVSRRRTNKRTNVNLKAPETGGGGLSRRRTNTRTNADFKSHCGNVQGQSPPQPHGSRNVHRKSQPRPSTLRDRSTRSLPE
ncbi:hypothetical protein COLO4_23406 [Corchorus olitorius]|uniref:PORR domain-containing protein n=1 Tax=Corchorus olitorius TaxID=93759 RepID=A0A1R3IGY6_9ROSI|nr:hypothetical protein COLO4_23406 [Corchorus olitorius]